MSFTGQNLTCVRGNATIFSALDFSLTPGAALTVRGPNGSGKSSLLRIAAGFLSPADGELRRDGALVTDEPERHMNNLHYVGHLDALKPAYTVSENLEFWARLFIKPSGPSEPPRTGQALEQLGLSALSDMPAQFLSAGQRRRLALARLIAAPRPLWLLDEPGASLDDAGSDTLAELIGEHRAGGGMAMIAVHGDLNLPDVTTLQMASSTGRTAA